MCIHTYIYIYNIYDVYTYVYMCVYACMYVLCVYMYTIYIYIYIYIHACAVIAVKKGVFEQAPCACKSVSAYVPPTHIYTYI